MKEKPEKASTKFDLRFDLDFVDFFKRWQKARVSAIHKSLSTSVSTSILTSPQDNPENEPESELLKQFFSQEQEESASEESKNTLLKNIFDHSRILGLSLSKNLGIHFEIQDFRNLLAKSDIPCAQGVWESRKTSEVVSRKGCDFCPQGGAHICDYWRESLDGLVMGLGEKERFVRHACARRGDFGCVDVFFYDAEKKTETSLAWGPLPDHMAASLAEICQDFEEKMKTHVLLKGMNEGVLFFEFKASTDQLCGSGKMYSLALERKVQARYPGLKLQEITPRAVLGAEG